jgi:WD40 repeat protein
MKEFTDGHPTLITGGSDQLVCFVDPATLTSIRQIQLDSVPRSVDFAKFLLVGQRNGNILEYDINRNIKEVIMHSHHDGELWAISLIEERGVFVTAADDNKLLMFEIDTKKCIQKGWIDEPIVG